MTPNNEEVKLDKLLADIEKLTDKEMQSHLAKYFCVLVSGYLENSFKYYINNYTAQTKATKPIQQYVSKVLHTLSNLHKEQLLKIVAQFSKDWETKLRDALTEKQEEHLNTVVSQRHEIAHGHSIRSNITFKDMSAYYESIKEIVRHLSNIIKK